MAVADVDGDACNDVIAAGTYGRGMVHLGDGALGFDGGRDLPQLSATTRVSMAVGDLSGDGRPEVVIADKGNAAVMIYRNTSSPAGGPCFNAPPTAKNDVATVIEDAPLTTINVLANDTDPDGGPKLVASVTQPAHGSAVIGGGGVRYKPARTTATTWARRARHVHLQAQRRLHGERRRQGGVRGRRSAGRRRPLAPAPAASAATPAAAATSAHLHPPGTTRYTVGTPGDDVLVGGTGRDVLSGAGATTACSDARATTC